MGFYFFINTVKNNQIFNGNVTFFIHDRVKVYDLEEQIYFMYRSDIVYRPTYIKLSYVVIYLFQCRDNLKGVNTKQCKYSLILL